MEKTEATDLEWRMYGLVPYNLSPIQQGIQYGHALQEYNLEIHKTIESLYNGTPLTPIGAYRVEAFKKWAEQDKTFIILNGGTTNDGSNINGIKGTLNKHIDTLQELDLFFAMFREPDLQNAITAVVFLVDERVFNYEKYPNYMEWLELQPNEVQRIDTSDSRSLWVTFMGGETNVKLREFLKQFKLA